MDEYKHCINCLIARAKIIEMKLILDKDEADREYEKLLQWFKDSYIIKRKKSLKSK